MVTAAAPLAAAVLVQQLSFNFASYTYYNERIAKASDNNKTSSWHYYVLITKKFLLLLFFNLLLRSLAQSSTSSSQQPQLLTLFGTIFDSVRQISSKSQNLLVFGKLTSLAPQLNLHHHCILYNSTISTVAQARNWNHAPYVHFGWEGKSVSLLVLVPVRTVLTANYRVYTLKVGIDFIGGDAGKERF